MRLQRSARSSGCARTARRARSTSDSTQPAPCARTKRSGRPPSAYSRRESYAAAPRVAQPRPPVKEPPLRSQRMRIWRTGPGLTPRPRPQCHERTLRRSDARGLPPQLLLFVLGPGPGDPLGVEEEGDDEAKAADQERPVSGQAEPLVERVRQETLRRADAGDHGAGDHGDPAEVREGDQPERGERTEAA